MVSSFRLSYSAPNNIPHSFQAYSPKKKKKKTRCSSERRKEKKNTPAKQRKNRRNRTDLTFSPLPPFYFGRCTCFYFIIRRESNNLITVSCESDIYTVHAGVFFHSRVTGACPVTTDVILRVNVRTTTTKTTRLAGSNQAIQVVDVGRATARRPATYRSGCRCKVHTWSYKTRQHSRIWQLSLEFQARFFLDENKNMAHVSCTY